MPVPALDKFARTLHRGWDKLRENIGFTSDKPVTIAAYRGFGRKDFLYLSGRVLRQKKVRLTENDRGIRNLVKNFRRFNSREINGAKLEVIVGDNVFERTSDQEGYFTVSEVLPEPLSDADTNWRNVDIRIKSIPGEELDLLFHGEALVPNAAQLGVISDIDDTILRTDVTSMLKLRTLYLTLLKNAGSRSAFREVSAFYRALEKGADGEQENAFFYVSNSPWNLYDLLDDFLKLNDLPRGPIFLRDFGLPYGEKPEDYRGHKHDKIVRILNAYPDMGFILVGDSGEHDADIYLSVAKEYPDRIRAIYIRDVLHMKRAARITALIKEATDIPIKLVSRYSLAADHAAAENLIDVEYFRTLLKK